MTRPRTNDYAAHSKRLAYYPQWSRRDMEELIVMERLCLYNRDKPCGATALRQHLLDRGIQGVPSPSTIGRILARKSLTNGRTGYYPEDYL